MSSKNWPIFKKLNETKDYYGWIFRYMLLEMRKKLLISKCHLYFHLVYRVIFIVSLWSFFFLSQCKQKMHIFSERNATRKTADFQNSEKLHCLIGEFQVSRIIQNLNKFWMEERERVGRGGSGGQDWQGGGGGAACVEISVSILSSGHEFLSLGILKFLISGFISRRAHRLSQRAQHLKWLSHPSLLPWWEE